MDIINLYLYFPFYNWLAISSEVVYWSSPHSLGHIPGSIKIKKIFPFISICVTLLHSGVWLAFAKEHHNWQVWHWHTVLFTDESRFTLGSCDRQERSEEAVVNVMLRATLFSISILWWVSVGLGRQIHSTLTGIRYRNKKPRPIVRPIFCLIVCLC